jgi:uncharacterized membrane protein (DUF485 family)
MFVDKLDEWEQDFKDRDEKMKNKRGQVFTPITMVFLVITFVIVWALFGAKFLNDSIGSAMNTGYFTGIEGFLMSNLNLFIFFALLIAIISLGVYSASQQ